MSTELTVNEKKKIAKSVSIVFGKMEASKKGYVYSVIDLGDILIDAKKKVGHGNWESFCKIDIKSSLGGKISSPVQAWKYMEIAENKVLVLEYFNDEESVNNLTKAIASATPEQLQKVEQLKQAEIDKRIAAEKEAEEAAMVRQEMAEREAKRKAAQPKPEAEAIDAEFTEVKAGPVVEPERDDSETIEQILTEANEILANDNAELLRDIETVTKIFESNDQVATSAAEAKKYRELNRVLNERITGLMNEGNEAKKLAKYWKNRAEKAEKELESFKVAA